MFSRLLWVYPDWDPTMRDDPDIYADHLVAIATAGLEVLDTPTKSSFRRPCACIKALDFPVGSGSREENTGCFVMLNRTNEVQEEPIPRKRCHLLNRTVKIEAVKESVLLKLLRRRDPALQPIRPSDSWVLDLDEDYFGVEAAVLPLYNADMEDGDVNDLTEKITILFCADGATGEIVSDQAFQRLINFVRFDRESRVCRELKVLAIGQNSQDTTLQRNLFEEKLSALEKDCAEYVLRTGVTTTHIKSKKRYEIFPDPGKTFCSSLSPQERNGTMASLLGSLYGLTDHQLKALVEVGICLWSSLPGYYKNSMKVCDGFNRPNNESMVTFYTPTIADVAKRASRLKTIVQGLAELSAPGVSPSQASLITPRLITVARSGRDGYVPRAMCPLIERSMVKAVKDVFSATRPVNVVYDSKLFGGAQGWKKRPMFSKD